ncbi:unnamed protein product [Pleuronectes platessa]|uniref:Uncharacterized protein n=1 Tax=Pleuronectes platessa TaxID=8262 RepID=A0A9N7ZD91_PLEPL|nr:unnamed protein product [Pleuronectes platessa]
MAAQLGLKPGGQCPVWCSHQLPGVGPEVSLTPSNPKEKQKQQECKLLKWVTIPPSLIPSLPTSSFRPPFIILPLIPSSSSPPPFILLPSSSFPHHFILPTSSFHPHSLIPSSFFFYPFIVLPSSLYTPSLIPTQIL